MMKPCVGSSGSVRSREHAAASRNAAHRAARLTSGQDLEVGVELTWRARERTDRSVERLIATGEESDRVRVSAGGEPHSVGVAAGQPETHEYEAPEPAQCGVEPLHVTPHPPQLLVVSTGVSQPWSGPPLLQWA